LEEKLWHPGTSSAVRCLPLASAKGCPWWQGSTASCCPALAAGAPTKSKESILPPTGTWAQLGLKSPPLFSTFLHHLKQVSEDQERVAASWPAAAGPIEDACSTMLLFMKSNGLTISQNSELRKLAFVPVANGTRLVPPTSLFARLKRDLAPFAYQLPFAFVPYSEVLVQIGMESQPKPERLLRILQMTLVPAGNCANISTAQPRLIGRVDPDTVTFAHPQLTPAVCSILRIPPLQGIVQEQLDPSAALEQVDALQGILCKDVRQLLSSGTIAQALFTTLKAHQKPTASADLPEASELARRLQQASNLIFVRTCQTCIVHLASGRDAGRADVPSEVAFFASQQPPRLIISEPALGIPLSAVLSQALSAFLGLPPAAPVDALLSPLVSPLYSTMTPQQALPSQQDTGAVRPGEAHEATSTQDPCDQELVVRLLAVLAPPLQEGLQESCVAGCPGTPVLSTDRQLLQLQPLRPYAAGEICAYRPQAGTSQVQVGELLYCRMTVDNRPPAEAPVYRVRDVEMRIGELDDPLSSELYSFRSGQSLVREARPQHDALREPYRQSARQPTLVSHPLSDDGSTHGAEEPLPRGSGVQNQRSSSHVAADAPEPSLLPVSQQEALAALKAMTSAAGLPSMLDREELIAETMRLRSQHAKLQQRAEVQRKAMDEAEEAAEKAQTAWVCQSPQNLRPRLRRVSKIMGSTTPASGPSELFRGAMPKTEIGALEFLEANPTFDGRGVVVAIFDTGIDPGANGLQKTPDGKPKIIDSIDCTGSCDVATSKVVEADAEGCIQGLYGNMLKLNSAWSNPSGKWHVGAKRAFELYPGPLKKRMQVRRKERWDVHQSRAIEAGTAGLKASEDCKVPCWSKLDQAEIEGAPGDLRDRAFKLMASQENHFWRKESDERAKLLQDLEEHYKDVGPMLDCVVWHDGCHWRAALDTTDFLDDLASPGSEQPSGRLQDFAPMTNYSIEHKYGTFSAEDACNFVCNIYDDGNILSIVVDAGMHGTHVAGITAGYHPENPALNGCAPGAQIISCKIGDSRLGSCETNVGLTRALIAVAQHKADLINMSYGEPTATPNAGRFIDLVNEVVYQHGAIFISSAGNAGPALSTVGAAGGTTSAIMGIGAYVSPELAAAGHALREALPQGQAYNFTSRGPAADGDLGVSLCAPGGAVSTVPQWSQQTRQLANGTSMASPNACGGVALLLSGLKQSGLAITPARVRRALENTAHVVSTAADAAFTYGQGLLQVHKAFEYLQKAEDVDKPDRWYDIRVQRTDTTQSWQRGIYLRDPWHSRKNVSFICEVKPNMRRDADVKTEKLEAEDELQLRATADWLDCPNSLFLPFNGRTFEIKVAASSLPEGLHFAEVQGIDSKAPWRGPIFRIPVAVMRPLHVGPQLQPPPPTSLISSTTHDTSAFPVPDQELNPFPSSIASSTSGVEPAIPVDEPNVSSKASGEAGHKGAMRECTVRLGKLDFRPGLEIRRFVAVPEGATWGEMRLRAGPHETPKIFMIRAQQLLPHTRHTSTEKSGAVNMSAHAEHVLAFSAVAGATVELTIAQVWNSLGAGQVELDVMFHGLEVSPAIGDVLDGAAGNMKLLIRAPISTEKLQLSAQLSKVQIPLRPSSSCLQALSGDRDRLPNGKAVHSLILTYKLTVTEAGKHIPTLPTLNGYMYDSELEAQMFMIFDSAKQLMSTGDIYPEQGKAQLAKGDYTIRVLLRHESVPLLEKLRDKVCIVERELGEKVTVPIYTRNSDSIKAASTVKDKTMFPGERTAIFLGPVPEDKLPKDAQPGTLMPGILKLGKLFAQSGAGDIPGPVHFAYCVPPKKVPSNKDSSEESKADTEAEPTLEDQLKHAARDARLKVLKEQRAKIRSPWDSKDDALASQLDTLLEEHPNHLPILQERLKTVTAKDATDTPQVVKAANAIINSCNIADLSLHAARKSQPPGKKVEQKALDDQKAALLEALEAKLSAQLDLAEALAEALIAADQGKQAKAAAEGGSTSETAASTPPSDEAGGTEPATTSRASDTSKKDAAGQVAPADAKSMAEAVLAMEDTFSELQIWADLSDSQYVMLYARREALQGRPASALRLLEKSKPGDKPFGKDHYKLCSRLCSLLGWHHWQRYEESRIKDLFPADYPLF
ncbi:hypothetical protein WJX84_006426, partial [Apatococcus fuscideae]